MNKHFRELLAEVSKHEEGSIEYLEAMFRFHDEQSEWWDNKVGKTQDDNKCTREWNRHNRIKDDLFNQIQAIKNGTQVKTCSATEPMMLALISLATAKQQLDKISMETSLVCDNMKYDIATMIENIKSEMERMQELVKCDQA